MKFSFRILYLIGIFVAASCTQQKERTSTETTPDLPADSAVVINKDSLLLATGKKILSSLRSEDYAGFSSFFATNSSIRFSPYGFVDTATHLLLTQPGFDSLIINNKIVNWGNYDGTGDPINLTAKQYMKKFVYNADFFEAEKIAIDSIIGKGNSLINIDKIYPGARFIEYHFTGFDKKYAGMDWTSLRLVFREINRSYKLIAIVHDQWTI